MTKTAKPAKPHKNSKNKTAIKVTKEIVDEWVKLYTEGHSYRSIARQYDCDDETVARHVKPYLPSGQLAEQLIEEHNFHLWEQYKETFKQFEPPDCKPGSHTEAMVFQAIQSHHLDAIKTRAKILKDHADFNGLHAPTRVEWKDTTEKPESLDESIRQLTEEMNARDKQTT